MSLLLFLTGGVFSLPPSLSFGSIQQCPLQYINALVSSWFMRLQIWSDHGLLHLHVLRHALRPQPSDPRKCQDTGNRHVNETLSWQQWSTTRYVSCQFGLWTLSDGTAGKTEGTEGKRFYYLSTFGNGQSAGRRQCMPEHVPCLCFHSIVQTVLRSRLGVIELHPHIRYAVWLQPRKGPCHFGRL